MKKRILVYGILPPPYHGVAIMTQYILETLKKSGYEYHYINNDYSKSVSDIGRNKFYKTIVFIKIIVKSMKIVKQKNIEWIYYPISTDTWSFIRDAILLKILSYFVGRKIILHYHGIGIRDLYNKNFFLKRIVEHTLVNAGSHIVLGDRLKEDIDMCVDHGMIQVVPNGIEIANQKHKCCTSNKDSNVIRLLYLSYLRKSKGIDTAVKCIDFLIKKYNHTKIHLTVAGKWRDPKTRSLVEKFIKDNNLDKYISFVGEKINQEKWNLFENSDIFLFPTVQEAFGLVNLEAMQFGLPIITTDVGAIPEFVKDGVNGFIVDPNDPEALAKKVDLLINNKEIANKIRENNFRNFERYYTVEKFSERFVKALENIVEEYPDRGIIFKKHLIIKPDNFLSIYTYAENRPHYTDKVRKLLYFIFREGLCKSIRKILSKEIESTFNKKKCLIIASLYQQTSKKNYELIAIGMQFSERLDAFKFHKDLVFINKNKLSLASIKHSLLKDKVLFEELVNYDADSGLNLNKDTKRRLIALIEQTDVENREEIIDELKSDYMQAVFKVHNNKNKFNKNLIILGCGDYVRSYVIPQTRHVNKYMLVDYNAELAEHIARKNGFSCYATHHRNILDNLRDVVNPVAIIATYHSTHAEIAKAIYEANKNSSIFIEKPVVVGKEQLTIVKELIHKGARIEAGFNRRYIDWVILVKDILQNSQEPKFISINIKEVKINSNHWYLWANQGTRITGNLCHWLDLIVYWLPYEITEITLLNSSINKDSLALGISLSDGSLVNIMVSEDGNSLRGVQENYEIRFGDTTIIITDFLKMTILDKGRVITKVKIRRDKGHDKMYEKFFNQMATDHFEAYYSYNDMEKVVNLTHDITHMFLNTIKHVKYEKSEDRRFS